MIKVDGKEYNVDVTELGLDVEFIYKYAQRTENFELKYELGAVYYNQQITFGTTGILPTGIFGSFLPSCPPKAP